MKSTAFNHANNTDTINSFDKQIDFFNSKEKIIGRAKKELENRAMRLNNEKLKKKVSNENETKGNERKKPQIGEKQKTVDISE